MEKLNTTKKTLIGKYGQLDLSVGEVYTIEDGLIGTGDLSLRRWILPVVVMCTAIVDDVKTAHFFLVGVDKSLYTIPRFVKGYPILLSNKNGRELKISRRCLKKIFALLIKTKTDDKNLITSITYSRVEFIIYSYRSKYRHLEEINLTPLGIRLMNLTEWPKAAIKTFMLYQLEVSPAFIHESSKNEKKSKNSKLSESCMESARKIAINTALNKHRPVKTIHKSNNRYSYYLESLQENIRHTSGTCIGQFYSLNYVNIDSEEEGTQIIDEGSNIYINTQQVDLKVENFFSPCLVLIDNVPTFINYIYQDPGQIRKVTLCIETRHRHSSFSLPVLFYSSAVWKTLVDELNILFNTPIGDRFTAVSTSNTSNIMIGHNACIEEGEG